MKKVALFATILALALSASAQQAHYPGPTAVGPNARNGANPNGVSTSQAANARSVSADAKQGPTVVGSHAVEAGPITEKLGGICLPILIWGGPTVGLGCK